MARKTTTAEVLCYVIASLTLFANILSTFGAIEGILEDKTRPLNVIIGHIILCLVLWLEPVAMFKGLKHEDPACMIFIKWFNAVKCLLVIVAAARIMSIAKDPQIEAFLITLLAVVLVWAIFVVCVTHRLEKFYKKLLKDPLKDQLITA